MHKRTPPSDDRNAQRQRRYRQRVAKHQVVAPVPVDEAMINLVIKTNWLKERDARSRKAIGAAIARMLADAARHLP